MTVVGGNIKTELVSVETPQEQPVVEEKPKKTTKKAPKKGDK